MEKGKGYGDPYLSLAFLFLFNEAFPFFPFTAVLKGYLGH